MRPWFAYLLTASVLVAIVAACGHFQPTSQPLYPGPSRPAGEVARLSGPIAKVDGVDVSRLGGSFDLLPGCHVVELKRKVGEGSVGGAWSADLGHVTYALRMRAGQSYEINIRLQAGNSASVGNATVGAASVEAVERDASGKTVANLLPARQATDIDACQRWDEEQTKQASAADGEETPDAASSAGRG
jgi:hypothetical protein